jgi:hypothetical protein
MGSRTRLAPPESGFISAYDPTALELSAIPFHTQTTRQDAMRHSSYALSGGATEE